MGIGRGLLVVTDDKEKHDAAGVGLVEVVVRGRLVGEGFAGTVAFLQGLNGDSVPRLAQHEQHQHAERESQILRDVICVASDLNGTYRKLKCWIFLK